MRHTLRAMVLIGTLLAALVAEADSSSSQAREDIRTIETHHRPAAELAAELRPFLAPDGTLTATARGLIIRTDAHNFEQLQSLAHKLDKTPQTLTLEVRFSRPPKPNTDRYRSAAADQTLALRVLEGKMTRIALQRQGPQHQPLPWQRIESEPQPRHYRELMVAAYLLDERATLNILAVNTDSRPTSSQQAQVVSQVNAPLEQWIQVAGRTHLGRSGTLKHYRLPGADADAGVYVRLSLSTDASGDVNDR